MWDASSEMHGRGDRRKSEEGEKGGEETLTLSSCP